MGFRVAVIGAGFAGLEYARELARAGAEVTLYEEHDRVGYPEHCTGLVSGWVVEAIGPPARSSVAESYEGIEICGTNDCVRLRVKGGLYKLDRILLEKLMLEEAMGSLDVRLSTRVEYVSEDGRVYSAGRVESYDLIVIAEGMGGRLRRRLGIGLPASYKPLIGLNVESPDACERASGAPRVVFDEKLTPGFFAWEVPLGSRCLYGAASTSPQGISWLLRLGGRVYGGPVLRGPPARRLWRGRVVVVGDAAGLNKPLTGGGLYPNTLAAVTARELIEEGREPIDALKASVKRVAGILHRAYPLARLIHGNPGLVDCLARAVDGLQDELEPVEYDDHASMAREALSKPSLAARLSLRTLRHCGLPGSLALLRAVLAGILGLG